MDRRQTRRKNDIIQLDGSEISGTIQGINDGNILIKSDLSPDALPLPIDGVKGVHLALSVDQPRGIYLAASSNPNLPPLKLVPTSDGLVLQSSPKQVIDANSVALVTVYGGRRVFLNDLKPSKVEEEGAFGVVWNYGAIITAWSCTAKPPSNGH